MTAIDKDNVKIYIVDADTVGSDLADSDLYKGQITSVDRSGGEREQETTNAFGGDITRQQPRSEFELSMEITPSYSGEVDWVELFFGEDGTNSSYYTSAQQPTNKAVYIEAGDGSTTTTHAFNNLQAVSEEMEHPADDARTLSLTFNTAPLTTDGLPNYAYTNDAATNFVDWSTFDSS